MELDQTSHFTNLYTLVGCLTKAIDLVSPEMSGHHRQVAYLSHKIAEALDVSFETDRSLIVAALIHDVGAIDSDESEPFRRLEQGNNLDQHARLDGKGYPFKLDARNLSMGSRIMAVADIFSAITEDRPYRKGMPKQKAIAVLNDLAKNDGISPYICLILFKNYDDVACKRKNASEKAVSNFETWQCH
ncbi:MAG: HD domain-containing protein [Atopobiaceae bacterium]|jgi:HD-GYP domain-containing protein (c-di-GMP phosphodiesterase class II)|nr:HD domain-containing protein [Atopobiaceae bacterium]